MAMCGGLGNAQPATAEIQELCDKVKSAAESKGNLTFSQFVAVEYKSQVVAGMNYFVKVDVGEGQFVHLRIYRDLQNGVELSNMQTGKAKEDPLEYF